MYDDAGSDRYKYKHKRTTCMLYVCMYVYGCMMYV